MQIAEELMTDFQNLLFEKKNQIAYITLNRPKVLNALNMATMEELRQAFAAVKDDTEVRVVILTGSGEKAFVAGADIGELSQHNPVSAKEYTHKGQAIIDAIENLGKPTIACINGFALGGGCELAMAGDIRIASENARFGQPEVNLGLIPGYGGSQRTTRLLGKGMAMFLCLSGDMIDAQMALEIGLVERVVAQDELLSAAKKLAQTIAQKAPLAITACKRAINNGAHLPIADALELEALEFGTLVNTNDFKEGTSAFLEKRKADWKGN
jgi:enoyl-CoA hydratase